MGFVMPANTDPLSQLCRTGQRLPHRLRNAILALGEVATPRLIDILQDEELADADGPHGGWAPIHAAELLADLKAADAIGPLLDMLIETDFDEIIHSKIEIHLPKIGAAVLEPTLARLPEAVEDDGYSSVCSVLSRLPVKDERIYQALCRMFEHDQVLGGIFFADYGDKRALPLLDAAIRGFEPDLDATIRPDMVDLIESYQILAGSVPEDLRAKADAVITAWRLTRSHAEEPAAPAKVGRNDPCICGSGKKYKRCCLGAEA